MIKTLEPFKTADELPPALASALLQWILAVADSKHRIGLQFSHWVTGTPALEAAVGAAAITQDELGHARSLYALLKNYPGAPDAVGAENDLEARDIYYAPAAIMPRWESWLQLIAVNLIFDSALQVAIAQTHNSAFQPLAGRTAKILQEEKFHRIFGHSWVERLVSRDDESKERLQEAIDWAWSITNSWLGPADDPITNQLVDAGILAANTTAIREQWLAEITPFLSSNGLTLSNDEPIWADWDSQFRHCNHA